ncbi:MAG: hypothetical protein FWE83_10225 [Oscillospiraceae bacterium]|nr:hypothetical protein [Oscillospiraceae bacterium]
MDYAQMKQEKEARYKEYCETYAEQLRLQGYIDSLEKDNEHNRETVTTTNRGKRVIKRYIKINDKDIKKYKKTLSTMPPLPEFK